MKPITQDSDNAQYWALVQRLERLERSMPKTRMFDLSSAASVDMGSVDGENITGVRISGTGLVSGATNPSFIRIKPNGLSSMSTNAIGHQVFLGGGPAYTATESAPLFGGGIASSPGLSIASASEYGGGSNYLYFEGVLFTKGVSPALIRMYQGRWSGVDNTTDGNRITDAVISSRWHDTTTAVTSLTLALDSGTFTGRVVMEILQ